MSNQAAAMEQRPSERPRRTPVSVYLTLPDNVGLAPPFIRQGGKLVPNPKAGEPEPLNSIGVPIQIPVMADGEVIDSTQTYRIEPAQKLGDGDWARIVPDTRIVEVNHEGLANVLRTLAGYVDCDPPKKSTPKQSKED
jgi:hypothetical protein